MSRPGRSRRLGHGPGRRRLRAINGFLVGYLRLRAFTTLVTLIIFRSIYDLLFVKMSTAIVAGSYLALAAVHRRGRSWALPPRRPISRHLAYRSVAYAAGLAADRRRRRPALGL